MLDPTHAATALWTPVNCEHSACTLK